MRRTRIAFATLLIATFSIAAGTAASTEAPSVPAAAQTATPSPTPATEAAGGKITKSRSNIQNNREATPAKSADAPTEPDQLVKPKTKSNQSND